MTALVALPTKTPPIASTGFGIALLSKQVARDLAKHPDRDAVLAECRAVVAASNPVPVGEFARTVERLRIHYPAPARLSEAQEALMMSDWLRLLGHLPADILNASVDTYLMTDARFMPTPGQLNAIAEPMWKVREHLARRAREAMDLMVGAAAGRGEPQGASHDR